MSSSVMLARTRMWRTMVDIMRGANRGGARWQRAQLERKRFSPSRCRFSSWVELAEAAGAGASLLELDFDPAPAPATETSASNMPDARSAAETRDPIFIGFSLPAPAA